MKSDRDVFALVRSVVCSFGLVFTGATSIAQVPSVDATEDRSPGVDDNIAIRLQFIGPQRTRMVFNGDGRGSLFGSPNLAGSPGHVESIGGGCGAGNPRLVANEPPTRGQDFEVRTAGVVAAVSVVWIGLSDRFWNGVPLPMDLSALGAANCSLRVSLDVGLSGTGGVVVLPIPDVPAVVGLGFFMQATALNRDPAAPLILTNALHVVVGST